MAPHTSVAERDGWDERDARVDLVHLVYLVQPNKRDRPADPRVSRATVCIAGGLLPHPAKARGIGRESEDVLCRRPDMNCLEKDDSHRIAVVGSDNA